MCREREYCLSLRVSNWCDLDNLLRASMGGETMKLSTP